jgi:hypothetical protein
MKRKAFALSIAMLAWAGALQAGKSPAGMDYMALTENDSKAAWVLERGEAEFLRNAREDYGSDAEEGWRALISELFSPKITRGTIDEFESYTPCMLRNFLFVNEERYTKNKAYRMLKAVENRRISELVTGKSVSDAGECERLKKEYWVKSN